MTDFEVIAERNQDTLDYHADAVLFEALVDASEEASCLVHDIMVQKDCITYKIDGVMQGILIWCNEEELYFEFEMAFAHCGPVNFFQSITEFSENLVANMEMNFH